MAGLGVLIDENGTSSYAYKIKVPAGTVQGSIVDLSNPSGGPADSFMDTFQRAKSNADGITNTYADGSLVSQSIIEDTVETYSITYGYTSGTLTTKTISKTTGGSIVLTYNYDVNGVLTSITQNI